MNLKALRFVVLVLSTLTVGMKFAHVLELTPKLALPPETYITVQTQLYQLFGSIGPIIDIAMVLGAIILAFHVYPRKAFPYTVIGVVAMLLSLGIWALFVLPANMPLNDWQASGVMPADWMRWRDQWQYGQLASFVCDLIGYGFILFSVVRETPSQKFMSAEQ
jgi:hypothetical protein